MIDCTWGKINRITLCYVTVHAMSQSACQSQYLFNTPSQWFLHSVSPILLAFVVAANDCMQGISSHCTYERRYDLQLYCRVLLPGWHHWCSCMLALLEADLPVQMASPITPSTVKHTLVSIHGLACLTLQVCPSHCLLLCCQLDDKVEWQGQQVTFSHACKTRSLCHSTQECYSFLQRFQLHCLPQHGSTKILTRLDEQHSKKQLAQS